VEGSLRSPEPLSLAQAPFPFRRLRV